MSQPQRVRKQGKRKPASLQPPPLPRNPPPQRSSVQRMMAPAIPKSAPPAYQNTVPQRNQVMKMPKQKTRANQGHKLWLHTIAEPASFPGGKIPDACSRDSVPLCVVSTIDLPAPNAALQTGALIGFGAMRLSTATLSAASTDAVLGWNAAVDDPRLADITNDYSEVRLVSSCVFWACTNKFLNQQGQVHGVVDFDGGNLTTAQAEQTSVAIMDTRRYHYRNSLATRSEGSAVWIPTDRNDYMLTSAGTSGFSGNIGTSAYGGQAHGTAHFVFNGLDATARVTLTIVRNYEGIPVSSKRHTLLTTPSHHDPFDLAMTTNNAGRVPKFNTQTQADVNRVSQTPMVQTYKPPTCFLDTIASGISTVAGVANEVINSPLGETIANVFKLLL